MKHLLFSLAFSAAALCGFSQKTSNNTLLWKISGNHLSRPSYLFGTIHMLCADDIQISDSLKSAIKQSDKVYLELDMDNIFEMLGVMGKMKMRNDTTLADLLTAAQYDSVKTYFKTQNTMLPFSMLETYKPMLTASLLMQGSTGGCANEVAMEQLIMQETKAQHKSIKGLETMAFQMSIFDSIPYRLQAQQLLSYVENAGDTTESDDFAELSNAYRSQNLDTLEAITKRDDMGISNFTELLLYKRNAAWAKKLDGLMKDQALVIAVGAGHLPGERGVINLLRKAGYKVEPVANDMRKKPAEKQM